MKAVLKITKNERVVLSVLIYSIIETHSYQTV